MRITTGGLPRILAGVALSVVSFAAFGASFAWATSPKTSASTTATTAPAVNPITALASIGPASATGRTVSLAKGAQGIFLIGPNGHTLYIYQPGELPARVYRLDIKSGQRTLWKELMPSDPAGVENIGPIYMTPDAKTCVFGYHRMLADLYLVEGLK